MLPDKLFIANIKKGSNSVNTGDRVMFLALCNFPHDPLFSVLSFIQFSCILSEIHVCSGQAF